MKYYCNACKKALVLGVVDRDGRRFCNAVCAGREAERKRSLAAAKVPADLVALKTQEVHTGPCPRCGTTTNGPVDVHTAHFAYSFVFATRWGAKPAMCCRRCATREQVKSTLVTAVLGWWESRGA